MTNHKNQISSRVKNLTTEKLSLLARRIKEMKKEMYQHDTKRANMLAAFVVTKDETSLTADDLRDFLSEKIPYYMIPSMITFSDKLPLTHNGKVDRKVLAERATQDVVEKKSIMPRNKVESVLQCIWKEVLGREQIGVTDNFFHLGGHSLQVMILFSKIKEIFEVDHSFRSIFDFPTIAQFADQMLRDPDQRKKVEKTAQIYLQLLESSEDEVEEMLHQKENIK